MRAFSTILLKLALYPRRDSNPQPLTPEANDRLDNLDIFLMTERSYQFLFGGYKLIQSLLDNPINDIYCQFDFSPKLSSNHFFRI